MKKRILFFLHKPPPVHGSSIMGGLIEKSSLINSNFKTKYINIGTSNSVKQINKWSLLKVFKYCMILLKTILQLVKFNPDIVYIAISAKGIAFFKDALIVFLSKLFKKKIVFHFHNKGVSENQNKLFYDNTYKLVFRNTKVVLISKLLYNDVKKYFNHKNVFYCKNGIKDSKINIKKMKNKSGKTRILFLSNLIETKGVFILLEALKILKKKKIDFFCDYAGGEGDISLEEFNKKVEFFGLKKNVIYHGKKFGKEKKALFLKADIFAFPTFYSYETFGIVNVEAMMYGLPVISTNEGAITDVIDHMKNGLIIEKQNPYELSKAVEYLIHNPEKRYKMGVNAQNKFKKEFTLKVFEKRLLTILQKL